MLLFYSLAGAAVTASVVLPLEPMGDGSKIFQKGLVIASSLRIRSGSGFLVVVTIRKLGNTASSRIWSQRDTR